MSRDQQDGHGFGICVKGGKDAGKFNLITKTKLKQFLHLLLYNSRSAIHFIMSTKRIQKKYSNKTSCILELNSVCHNCWNPYLKFVKHQYYACRLTFNFLEILSSLHQISLLPCSISRHHLSFLHRVLVVYRYIILMNSEIPEHRRGYCADVC